MTGHLRERIHSARQEVRFLHQLRVLPIRVARFQWRAYRLSRRSGDLSAFVSSTRPHKLATLLAVADHRQHVVELGTAAGWTSICLALADPGRVVVTYDPAPHPMLDRYFELAGPAVRERIEFIRARGDQGPGPAHGVDLLYIDSGHDRDTAISEFQAWRPVLRTGSTVAFDDFTHPEFPGVSQAVRELGLDGEVRNDLFIHHVT